MAFDLNKNDGPTKSKFDLSKSDESTPEVQEPKKSNNTTIIIVVVLAVIALAVYLFTKEINDSTKVQNYVGATRAMNNLNIILWT